MNDHHLFSAREGPLTHLLTNQARSTWSITYTLNLKDHHDRITINFGPEKENGIFTNDVYKSIEIEKAKMERMAF